MPRYGGRAGSNSSVFPLRFSGHFASQPNPQAMLYPQPCLISFMEHAWRLDSARSVAHGDGQFGKAPLSVVHTLLAVLSLCRGAVSEHTLKLGVALFLQFGEVASHIPRSQQGQGQHLRNTSALQSLVLLSLQQVQHPMSCCFLVALWGRSNVLVCACVLT